MGENGCVEAFVAHLSAEAKRGAGESPSMGMLERELERAARAYQRQALSRLVQERAQSMLFECPRCGRQLLVEAHRRNRTVNSRFGKITFTRSYGYCKKCKQRTFPADQALGLQGQAPASPRVQEICALTVLRDPAVHAQKDTQRLTGLDMDPSCIHREARRQGARAVALRDADTALSRKTEGTLELIARASSPKVPFTLVIEIDAWNIRERDNWGLTKKFRKAGKDTGRWHWVYTGTLFRLDQRATTASGRPVILERGFVATRLGLDAFREQLYAEALQRGLTQAETVLVLGDGAVWIWNLAKDRFKDALHRVDLYHVTQHLWAVAHDLYGQASDKAPKWIAPYLGWLKRRQDGALDMIRDLTELRTAMGELTSAQRANLDREIEYFNEHKNRMDYKRAKALGQPLGSGAIESTCSQYQGRFKLRGQFWSLEGDESLLALATLHLNDRWNRLFPHDDTS